MRQHILYFLVFSTLLLSCKSGQIHVIDEFIELKGNKIHFKSEGKGHALLFLHGGYLNLGMWDEQAAFFVDKGYQVIRFSDLGHGLTERSEIPTYSYEIIDTLLLHLDIEKLTIIGLSWGSMMGVDYCLHRKDKVDKLVLVSPGLKGWDYFQDSLAGKNYQARQKAMELDKKSHAAKLFYKNWVVGPSRNEANLNQAFLQKSLQMIERTMNQHWKEDWSIINEPNTIDKLKEINQKTLIVHGDQDASDIISIAEIYQSNIPHATRVIAKDLAHAINLENPAFFHKTLWAFLQ